MLFCTDARAWLLAAAALPLAERFGAGNEFQRLDEQVKAAWVGCSTSTSGAPT